MCPNDHPHFEENEDLAYGEFKRLGYLYKSGETYGWLNSGGENIEFTFEDGLLYVDGDECLELAPNIC